MAEAYMVEEGEAAQGRQYDQMDDEVLFAGGGWRDWLYLNTDGVSVGVLQTQLSQPVSQSLHFASKATFQLFSQSIKPVGETLVANKQTSQQGS